MVFYNTSGFCAFRRLIVVILFSLILIPAQAYSLTVDNFKNSSHNATAVGAPSVDTDSSNTTSAIGGARTLRAENTFGTLKMELEVEAALETISHSQDAGVKGESLVIWDGDTSAALNSVGLGGVDFTQDGADSVEIDVVGYDPGANGTPIDMTITFYDGSDATGTKFWFYTHTFNAAVIVETKLSIPFTSFTASGGGSVDFTNVGAVTLFVNGNDTAVDLTLSRVGTNGLCVEVPDANGKVIDQCGVCGGDNSTCKDCLGIINGPNVPGATCDTKLASDCKPGQYSINCSCEPINPPTNEICDGKDNDCDGDIDENFDCTDCKGVVNGTATEDQCGVCEGDGTTCRNCEDEDLQELLTSLDGGAKEQEKLIRTALKRLKSVDKTVKTRKFIQKTRKTTHELQLRNWTLSWTVPVINTQCDVTAKCIVTSNEDILSEYRINSETLRGIGLKVMRKTKKARGSLGAGERGLVEKIKDQHKHNLILADTVPVTNTSCT
ncbi:MAG: putative metal-binding motif-containing protein [Bdellovibrionales bacterium]|nr:putative metal-binding motif-containing protein [Bdellovibrionales bacterium]